MVKKRFPLQWQVMMMVSIVVILLLSVLSFSLYELIQVGQGAEKVVQNTASRMLQIKEGQLDFAEALKGLRGFLLYSAANYEQESREGLKKSLSLVQAYNASATTEDIKAEGGKLEKNLSNYVAFLDKVIAAKKANDPKLNELLGEGRQLTADIDQQYAKLADLQKKYMDEEGQALFLSAKSMTNKAVMASVIIGIGVLGYGFWYSRNLARRMSNVKGILEEVGRLDLTGKDVYPTRNDEIGDMALTIIHMRKALKEFVTKVAQTSGIVGDSSNSLSGVVDEQMRAVESVADSATQIAGGAAHNVDNISAISVTLQQMSARFQEAAAGSGEVSSSANAAVEEASRGMELLDSVVRQNEYTAEAMADINRVTENLAKASDKIKGIIDVINSLAGQTNLLALNAAIEAARAGEAGRGFAVVAEEVRKLAEQSGQATKDIVDIIGNMGEEINRSVTTVSRANQEVNRGKEAAASTKQGFDAILQRLQTVEVSIGQIADTVEEVAKGSQDMVVNVGNINAVAEETSANCEMVAASAEEQSARMHEIRNSAEELAQMAKGLNAVVQQFKV